MKKLDLASGQATTLYGLKHRVDLGLAISPDHRYLLFAEMDSIGGDLMSVENLR